jgi:hypothetical protein
LPEGLPGNLIPSIAEFCRHRPRRKDWQPRHDALDEFLRIEMPEAVQTELEPLLEYLYAPASVALFERIVQARDIRGADIDDVVADFRFRALRYRHCFSLYTPVGKRYLCRVLECAIQNWWRNQVGDEPLPPPPEADPPPSPLQGLIATEQLPIAEQRVRDAVARLQRRDQRVLAAWAAFENRSDHRTLAYVLLTGHPPPEQSSPLDSQHTRARRRLTQLLRPHADDLLPVAEELYGIIRRALLERRAEYGFHEEAARDWINRHTETT